MSAIYLHQSTTTPTWACGYSPSPGNPATPRLTPPDPGIVSGPPYLGRACPLPGMICCVADDARARREAIRLLADARRRLAAAEDALAIAQAARKQAEEDYDGASDRFTEAESALDAARERRARAREQRYAARQAHERASTAMVRLQRRVAEMSERLDRMAELRRAPVSRVVMTFSPRWPARGSRPPPPGSPARGCR
jgi:hypothetical protein